MEQQRASGESEDRASLLDRAMGVFGDVRAGESASALLMLLNIFLILAGYYICKTVREPLILAGGGAEVKSYSSAGQAIVLMGFIPLYSWFASRVDRLRLIIGVMILFIVNLEMFWLAAKAGVPYLGVAFFIWVGIFNNAVIAQFWSYGNDIYRLNVGERLFPIIGIGATLGSPVGAWIAGRLFKMGISAYSMLHITAVILAVSIALFWLVEKREGARRQRTAQTAHQKLDAGPGGFALLLRSPYLRLFALLLVVLNLVNTTGGYVLDKALVMHADGLAAADPAFSKEAFIGAFAGDFLFWVNILAVVIQALLVSRIVKFFGFAGVLLALPIVALGAYGAILAGATFTMIRLAKTAENATDYSVMNTARHMTWLPTSREEKYKAKQAADTFVVRAGDVFSAGLVYVGTTIIGLNLRSFAAANILLVVLWLAVAVLLLRERRALSARAAAEEAA